MMPGSYVLRVSHLPTGKVIESVVNTFVDQDEIDETVKFIEKVEDMTYLSVTTTRGKAVIPKKILHESVIELIKKG